MGVSQPAEVNQAFADAFNARDRGAFLRLYDAQGAVVNPDGSMAVGHDQVARHVDQLLQLGGTMSSTNEYAYVNGDIALVGARFRVEFDDGRAPIAGRTAEVLVRSGDEWVYWLDHPFALPG
jgi:ketosteroid isomerase-like protein